MLPYPWKFPGLFLISAGFILAILYLWFDFRFTMPVFAVFSSFVETKMFETFTTNFADDLIMLLFVCGFGFIVFSKEKVETQNLDSVRYKAISKAAVANNIFIIFSILFVYGSGFIAVLVLNLFSFSVFYLFIFYFLKKKEMSILRMPPEQIS